MNILDYNPNFGTFSSGFEIFSKNEVVDVVKLSGDAVYGYNRIHKQYANPTLEQISTYKPENHIDLAIFRPDFGENIGGRSKSSFYFYDFQACLSFLESNMPEFAIFQTEVGVIPLVNNAPKYVRDGFNQPSKDRIIYLLKEMGYEAYLVVLDEAEYGIPLHRRFAFYVATPNGFDFGMPKSLFTAAGQGGRRRFRTVGDAIGDLKTMGEWAEYSCRPQNQYQRWMREDGVNNVTWHQKPKIQAKTLEKIRAVQPGKGNTANGHGGRSGGYNRARWDRICPAMDHKFYLASSTGGDSIHPIADRPFSIREGCRIHGLPDRLSFDLKTQPKDLAKMIHYSVAPAIGQIFSMALGMTD